MCELPALRRDPPDQLLRLLGAFLVLDPRVQVFGVFADDDQVDVLEAGADAGIRLARTHLAVEVEALPEGDVDGAEAASDRRGDGSLEGDPRLADRVEHLVRERVAAVPLHRVGAGLANVPVELHTCCLEDTPGGLGQLGPCAVSGDQSHSVGHGATLAAHCGARLRLAVPGRGHVRCQAGTWPKGRMWARVPRRMSLLEAAARADELAQSGEERELAVLRQEWDDELEGAARSPDYRQRAVAYRAIGQFRFRQKLELLRRGLEDESPAARGSALLSVQLLSKDSPSVVNAIRPLLHRMVTSDGNQAVRRLAVHCLRNGSPQRETIVILNGLAEDDDQEPELRKTARTVAAELKKRAGPKS